MCSVKDGAEWDCGEEASFWPIHIEYTNIDLTRVNNCVNTVPISRVEAGSSENDNILFTFNHIQRLIALIIYPESFFERKASPNKH